MKIQSIAITRFSHDTPEAVILDISYNLAEYGIFQKKSVKEFLTFATKTIMTRVPAGVHGIKYEDVNTCFCVVFSDGLGAIAVCDNEYPARVAVTMLRELVDQFRKATGSWQKATADGSVRFPPLDDAIVKYQKPAEVDKIIKLDNQLKDTKEVLYQTIESVLSRGEKLEELVAKSNHLSDQSKLFYRQAKKTNSCCIVM